MRKSFLQALILFILLALPLCLFWLRFSGDREQPGDRESSPLPVATPEDPFFEPVASQDAPIPDAEMLPEDPLETFWLDSERRDPRQLLAEWQAYLLAIPREEAVEQLWDYWYSGRDLSLGMSFSVGPEGRLQGTSTLRVAVLDLLGQLDPDAAHRLAAEALAGSKGSADEYALHLRNYAWGAPDEMDPAVVKSFLAERTRALIAHYPWRERPSEGFQEAFDVLVWSGAHQAIPDLVELMAPGYDTALTHPAGMALDRLVLLDPERAFAQLLEHPISRERFPRTEASYFARADPADSVQRERLEQWFLEGERGAEERSYLLQLLPNLNLRYSHNLLSEHFSWEPGSPRQRYVAVMNLLQDWEGNADFAEWRDEIREAIERVSEVLGGE